MAGLTGLLAIGGVLTNPAPALASPIGQPASVTVTPGRRLIKVEWTAPANGGATSYNVKASTGEVCTSAGLTCTLTPVAGNTPILVSVQACPASPADCSTWKDATGTVKAGPPATPPAPTVTYASADQTSMHLSWAENDEGAGIASYRVTPSPAFTTQTGPCTTLVTGTSCDVAGLTAGVSYTFKLTAIGINNVTGSTGSSGVGPASTPKYVGVPGTPDAPTITQDSNTAVTVSWTKPSGPGAAISGYTVQKTTGGQSTDGCTPVADATQCQVTGLDPTQNYTFKVRANGEGTFGGNSAYSSNSAALTPGKPNTPDAPTVELGAAAGQVRVNWAAPDGGGTVTGYVVTPYSIVDQSPPAPCMKDAAERYCDFAGLDDGVAYTFKVVAKGAVDSDASAASDPITSQLPAQPNAPTAELVADTPGAVRLTWTPQGTGGPVIFYNVTAIPATGNQTGASASGCGSNLTTPSCTVTGLDPTVSYTFKVTAVGDLGTAQSVASAPIVPNVPGIPTSASAALDDPTTVTVTWAAPAGGTGGDAASYTVTASPSDGTTAPSPCTKAFNVPLTCTFSGLAADKSYSFKVTATNTAGTGAEATADVRGQDVPDAAQSVAVALRAATPGAVDVNWTAEGTGKANRYVVTAVSTDGGASVTPCVDAALALTCPFTGLNTAKHYTFTVRAENILTGTDAAPITNVVPDRPGVPLSVAVTVPASGQATVTWEPPASGGAVAGYVVSAASSDLGASIPADCPTTSTDPRSCTFSLDAAMPYAFTVKAVNASGDQSATATDEIVPGAPGAPTSVAAALVSNTPGAITVTWDAPLGAAAVTKYVVTPAADDVNAVDPGVCEVTPPATRSCPFTGLTKTASYTFTVRAQNGAGGTNATDTAALIPDKPGAPASVTATRGTPAGKVVVTWAASGGGAVDSYTVAAESTDNAASTPAGCTVTGGDPRTCTITGLTVSAPYTFKVTATNTAGSSDASSTPALVPNVPDKPDVTVTVGVPGSATVTWAAPAAASAPPTSGWVVTPASGDGGGTPTPATCTVNWGDPRTCTFTNLTTSASYSFTVRATNEAGPTDSDVTPPVVANKPNAPGAPTAQITAPDKVSVTWTAPVGGGPVTKYNVDAYPTGTPNTPIPRSGACTDVTALTCEFGGLSDTLMYTFRVTATGSGGDTQGDRSAEVNMAGPGKPAAPTVALEGTNAVRVTWTPPNSGGPVTSYTVTADPDVSAPARCTNVKVLTCVFDRLTSGTDYTFQVYANGTADRSNASDDSATITVPAVISKPGTPGAPTVKVSAADQVQLSWTPPPGGGPATTYTATAFTAGAADTPIAFGGCTAITALACDFGGLSEAETYTFRVTATGPGGNTQGDRSKPVTTAGPGKPDAPTVQLTGPNAVTVSWIAPTGGPITGYSVTSTPDVSAPARCTNVKVLSCVFDRLVSGTAYTFKVYANGTADRSTASDDSATITVPAVVSKPDAPGAPAVLVSAADKVRLSWTAPPGGGPATTYTAAAFTAGAADTPIAFGGCTAITALACDFGGLSETETYTFRVTASGPGGNTQGDRSKPVTTAGPGRPAAPTVQLTGPKAVTVSWVAPTGGPITGYSVTSTPDASAPARCTNVKTLTCVFDRLTSGTAYTFAVTAYGTADRTAVSDASASIIPGPPGTPAAPTVALTNTTGQIRVTWTVPGVGGPIAGYQVQASPGGLGCVDPVGPTDTSCLVRGLDSATSYTFQVKALGAVGGGDSAYGPASAAITPGASAAPTDVEVAAGDRQIAVSWTAPSTADTGNSRVDHYRAVATPGGQYCEATTDTECIITDLANLTSYTVTVNAITAGGVSTPSASSMRVRPTAGRPGSPTAVQATVADTQTVVSWTAPTTGGSDIAWYTATAVDPSGVRKSCTTANGTTLSCTITGLTNGTLYSVTVVSVGRAASGYSAPSTAVTVTPKTAPGAPTGVTVTPGAFAKSLTVTWSAGSPSDGVTGYTATAGTGTSAPSCSTTSATVLTCTISGLTPGVYSVTVAAKGTGINSAPSAAVDGIAQLAVAPTLTASQPASGGTLTVSPTTARVGGTVTVSGTGFAPFTGVALALYAGGTKLGAATTNANGAFSVDVTIPTGTTTGSKTVVAAAQTSATVTTVKILTGALTVQAAV